MKIFNSRTDYSRMRKALCYYQQAPPVIKLSRFLNVEKIRPGRLGVPLPHNSGPSVRLVDIVCFCLMPTHVHVLLRQLRGKGISVFMSNVLNSYTRYFNTKYKRRGTLWEGRFKSVLIKTQEQLMHVTRYIHLNPVTAGLVEKPEEWAPSSYREYVGMVSGRNRICAYGDLLTIEAGRYAEFVNDRISYQRHLARIKKLMLE